MSDPVTPILPALFDQGLGAHLGFELVRAGEKEVRLTWLVDERHLQPWGLVHGGVHAAAVETACSLGASIAAGEGKQISGVENHTSFLRPVRSGRLECVARPLHVGRSSQLWDAQITDESGRTVAAGRLRIFVLGE